jgi:acyl dehydratase
MKWRVAPRVAGEKGGWEDAEKESWKRTAAVGFSAAERMQWVSVMGAVSARGFNQWEMSGAAVQGYGSGNVRWLAPVLIGTRLQSVNGKETRWTVTVRHLRAEAGFGGL